MGKSSFIHKYGPHIVIPAYSIMEMMKKDLLRRNIVSVFCQRYAIADEKTRRKIHGFLKETAPAEGSVAAIETVTTHDNVKTTKTKLYINQTTTTVQNTLKRKAQEHKPMRKEEETDMVTTAAIH